MPIDLNLSLVAIFHDGAGEHAGVSGHAPPPEKVPRAYQELWEERATDRVVITSRKLYPYVAPFLERHSWTVVIGESDFPGRTNARSPEEALYLARELAACVGPESEVFAVVGGVLRKHFLPHARRLYVMRIRSRPDSAEAFHEDCLALLGAGPFFHHDRLIAEPLNGWMAHVDLYMPEHRQAGERTIS